MVVVCIYCLMRNLGESIIGKAHPILPGVYFSIDNEKSTPVLIAWKHHMTHIINAYRIIKKESTHVKNPLPSVQPPTYYTQAGTSNSTLPKYTQQQLYNYHASQEKHRRTSNGSTGSYSSDPKRVRLNWPSRSCYVMLIIYCYFDSYVVLC